MTSEVLGVALPALMAGVVAIGVTASIERWGGRLGGLIGTLPSTIVPASLGIFAQSSTQADFEAAMVMTPVGMLLNALFLYLWRLIPPKLSPDGSLYKRLMSMVTVSLGAWAIAATATVLGLRWWREAYPGGSLIGLGFGTFALIVILGVWACRHTTPAPRGSKRASILTLLGRGVMAAVAIAVAVWFAAVGGPVAAGVAAVFPAIFLTTMVSLWLAQGEAVQVGAVGPMMLGSSSVAAFSLIAIWSFPALGGALGALVAWLLCAVGVTLPAWLLLRRLQKTS